MFSASITLLNGSPFHSPVTRKCIYHLHKTKLAVASSDKRNPRECEDCYVILGLIIYMFCTERASIVSTVLVIIILHGISHFSHIAEWGFVFIRLINLHGIFCMPTLYLYLHLHKHLRDVCMETRHRICTTLITPNLFAQTLTH